MQIELHHITVRELTAGYEDNNENGVRAYGGRLDVRPPYQREFVYKERNRHRLDFRRQHRGVYGQPPARCERGSAVAVLPSRHHMD